MPKEEMGKEKKATGSETVPLDRKPFDWEQAKNELTQPSTLPIDSISPDDVQHSRSLTIRTLLKVFGDPIVPKTPPRPKNALSPTQKTQKKTKKKQLRTIGYTTNFRFLHTYNRVFS